MNLVQSIEVLEFEERKTWQNCEEIIELLELEQSYIVADFKKKDSCFGPPISIRVSKEQAIHIFEVQGFKSNDLKYPYLLIVRKN